LLPVAGPPAGGGLLAQFLAPLWGALRAGCGLSVTGSGPAAWGSENVYLRAWRLTNTRKFFGPPPLRPLPAEGAYRRRCGPR